MILDSFLYVFSSAGNCAADIANRQELAKWKIIPRMLRDVTNRNLKVRWSQTCLIAYILIRECR
jgi:hypothetical protein